MWSFDSYNTIVAVNTSETSAKMINRTQHTILQRPAESSVPSGQGDQMVQLLEDLNETMAKNTDIQIYLKRMVNDTEKPLSHLKQCIPC